MTSKRKLDPQSRSAKRRNSLIPIQSVMAEAIIPTPPQLVAKTYPGLQEVHAVIVELWDFWGFSKTSREHPSASVPLSRQRLFDDAFHSLATVLEFLVGPKAQLSAHAQIVLRSAFGSAPQFVALFLPLFYEVETLHLLCDGKRLTDNVYGEFIRRLSEESSIYPMFHSEWDTIKSYEKSVLRNLEKWIVRQFRSQKVYQKAVIHRVTNDTSGINDLVSKQVVLNPTHPVQFHHRPSKCHPMHSDTAHVVGSFIDDPHRRIEFHLVVDAKACP